MKNKISPQVLLIVISLMVTFIVVQLNIFNFFQAKPIEEKLDDPHYGHIPRQKAEAEMYTHLHNDSPIPKGSRFKSNKTANNYYKNRAYTVYCCKRRVPDGQSARRRLQKDSFKSPTGKKSKSQKIGDARCCETVWPSHRLRP